MSKVASSFRSFELNHSLFELQIDDVPIWEQLRRKVYTQINRKKGVGQAHTSIGDDWQDYIFGVSLFLRNVFIKNPFFTQKEDILFLGAQRRKRREDGCWWDLYSDPVHENCDYDYVHFEKPYLLSHCSPAKTDNLRYLELITFGGKIQQIFNLNKPNISNEDIRRLEHISEAIQNEFDADVDIVSMARKTLHARQSTLWLYQQLLKRVDPKLAVVVTSYTNETFVEACKKQGIPIVELQHGVIHQNHLGYSYPEPRIKKTFPDYLLVWGEYWKNVVEYPIPNDRVIPVGYPYLEQTVEMYEGRQSIDQILFISQGTIGRQLSKLAMKINKHPNINSDIVYKLHPGEYDRWRDEYPWLTDAGFEIIDSSDPPLYELFAESSVQVGVYSTAVYEGLAFDLETYVYDCSGSDVLEPLIKEGSAELISSADDLATSLGAEKNSFESGYYFAPNATETMCDVLGHLADKAIQYRQHDC